jgi:hypothetical protein
VERSRDHRRIFKSLQQSNTNLTRMLEECRDNVQVGPIVDAHPLGNNSLDGAQGLAQNLNLPNMEQVLTASLPTFDYIPKDAINAVSQLWTTILNEFCFQPTCLEADYRTSCSPRSSCAHPSAVAPSMRCHSPCESSTVVSSGCSLAIRPPNGRW